MKKKVMCLVMSLTMILSNFFLMNLSKVEAATTVDLKSVENVKVDGNVATIQYNDGLVGKITFLEDTIFRLHIDPEGKFDEYATPNSTSHTGRIQKQKDSSSDYAKPTLTLEDTDGTFKIQSNQTSILLDKKTAKLSVEKAGQEVFTESLPISTTSGVTKQTLKTQNDEYFYGGGTQNGRFSHKGEIINIANENKWQDGDVTSPNPFYWSTKGYGVLRNTFKRGKYDFGKSDSQAIMTEHNENKFDAYYFLGENPKEILQGYFKVTGNPVLLPEYAYYLGHLNAYNRDAWTEERLTSQAKDWKLEDGNVYYEYGRDKDYKLPIDASGKIPIDSPYIPETLNGDSPISDRPAAELYKFSARAVIDGYADNDMPLGFFLPNDGYGAGYGQNGYYQNYPLGSNPDSAARENAISANVANLKRFVDYAKSKGVLTGLWTQSALTPDESEKDPSGYRGLHTLRDFDKEVNDAGVRTLKTDVAWVGSGYSFGLNATRIGFEKIAATNTRPNVISLDGWAGSQRHAAIWSGDQTGGNWEYIRFHIPTYIGQGLSGNPNIGSDVDGIFGGNALITTRDIQWKTFTPLMLDMDGWGAIPKKPYGHSDDNDDINRMYLKLKAELMPYLYSTAHEAVNGLPMIRAMFLEYPEDPKMYGKDVQYQFMYGSNFLVAPVYKNTQANANGDDIRSGIYLPDENEVWIDYFTGEKYQGGQILNNFDAPLWKMPLFVKSGSIVPMYEENNNPLPKTEINEKGLDKTKRVIEFYPSETKDSNYTLIEDDGMYIDGVDQNGDEKSQVSYGDSVSTNFTSKVVGDTATIIAGKSSGTYNGYDSNRLTTFVVNMTAEPTSIEAFNGNQNISLHQATSQAEFENLKKQGEGVYYYNAAPNLNKYATGNGEFSSKEITTTPKLYVSYPKTDVNNNEQKLVIKGYQNDDGLGKNEENPSLEVPTFNEVTDEDITPTSITLTWNKIDAATKYEMLVDGEVFSGFTQEQLLFKHENLAYDSEHTYQIRARNLDGYSKWSSEVKVRTKLDPWRNTPIGEVTSNIPSFGSNYDIKYAFDQKLDTNCFHTTQGDNTQVLNKDIVIKYDNIYTWDTFTYHWNGYSYITEMDIYTSLDGVHWELTVEGSEHPYNFAGLNKDDNPGITVRLNSVRAKYIKLVPRKSSGSNTSGFAVSEFIINKVDKSNSYPLGDFTLDGVVNQDDVTQIQQYKGAVRGDGNYESQVEPNNADINKNGVFDVYDYSFVMSQVDGGTKKSGVPSGIISADVNGKKTVSVDETFNIILRGVDLKNINALGAIFEYDQSIYDFIGVTGSDAIKDMSNFSAVSTSDGVKGIITVSFNNRGDKNLISGEQELFTIKMKAKQNANIIYPSELMLIGPKNDLKTIDVYRSDDLADKAKLKAAIDSAEKQLKEEDKLSYTVDSWDAVEDALAQAKAVYDNEEALQSEADMAKEKLEKAIQEMQVIMLNPTNGIKDITFTNDQMIDDDGSRLWHQTNWKEKMFDGNKNDLLEFKWYLTTYPEEGDIGAEVKLPTDFNFVFDNPRAINAIKVYNRKPSTSNGVITSIEAKGITVDGEEVSLGSYDTAQDVFEFKYIADKTRNEAKKPLFTKVIITPKTSVGVAKGTTTGTETNRMLSIYEIEFYGRIALDTKAYDALVKEISELDLSKYTLASIEALEQVQVATQKVVDTTNKQAEINQAVLDLQTAKEALVEQPGDKPDISQLEALINAVKDKDVSGYTTTSANAFKQALTDAQGALLAITQKEVNDAYVALNTAINRLVEKADTTALDALIAQVSAIDLTPYTKDSAQAVLDALKEAKAIDKDDASQEVINVVYDKLVKAKDGLINTIDKTKLATLIAEAKAIDISKYTLASVTKLNEVIKEAEILLQSPAIQEEVNAMVIKLETAIKELQLKEPGAINKEKLEKLIADAEKINTSIYTKESIKIFEEVLAKAKQKLTTATSQEEINAVYQELKEAMNQLVVRSSISNKNQSGSPKTGDEYRIIPYIALLIGASVILYRRRKDIENNA